mmetsp:Transcript_76980/g.184433  ORF Transcript_76980/g.184433 Transcript_76980/m.184433 type:complete len:216 (+) Transcript_76980:1083-1730(+)
MKDRSLQLKPATRMSRSPGTGCGCRDSTSNARFLPICVQSRKSKGQSGKFAFRNSCLAASNSTEKACWKLTSEPQALSSFSNALATSTGASVPEHMVPMRSTCFWSSDLGKPMSSANSKPLNFPSMDRTMAPSALGAEARRSSKSRSLASHSASFSALEALGSTLEPATPFSRSLAFPSSLSQKRQQGPKQLPKCAAMRPTAWSSASFSPRASRL